MSKFNVTDKRHAAHSPVVSERVPTGTTHEGAPGYARNVQGELFLLAVANMVNEKTFYEAAEQRDSRFEQLVRQATHEQPEWTAAMLKWLRHEANMRSAPLVGAAIYADQSRAERLPRQPRRVVDSVLQRADEPGEMLSFWHRRFGRSVPIAVKRGVGDAALRLYSQYALLKYDTATHGMRFADVLELTHPGDRKGARQAGRFQGIWQRDLFRHAIDRRHGHDQVVSELLHMILANRHLRSLDDPEAWLSRDALMMAGVTWEDALSAVGSKVPKAKLWEALIPAMGYMALLRNLRNFDEAGLSDETAAQVAARLADPEQVARSRQFPYRFLTAYLTAPSLRWGHALDLALTAATRNIPKLPGRTLVLVDTSGSMTNEHLSERSKMTPARVAALFGVALTTRNPGAELIGFATGTFVHRHGVPVNASVLRETERFIGRTGEVGHGTDIAGALRTRYRQHDRVIVISDMQTMSPGTSTAVPPHVPLYGFNLGGYQHGAIPSGYGFRHEFGGLTDATFRMIPLLEAGASARWPWEK